MPNFLYLFSDLKNFLLHQIFYITFPISKIFSNSKFWVRGKFSQRLHFYIIFLIHKIFLALHACHRVCLISLLKLAIHLLFLAFWLVRALFREIANQSLYTSHNIVDFVHLWFCKKLTVSSSLMFHENTDHLARMVKCEMRKMIGEMVYEMPSIHFSFLSVHQHFFTFSSIWR